MLTFSIKEQTYPESVTIIGVSNNLPYRINNIILNQLVEKLREQTKDLKCSIHNTEKENHIIVIINGSDINSNNIHYEFKDFCCEEFKELVRIRLL